MFEFTLPPPSHPPVDVLSSFLPSWRFTSDETTGKPDAGPCAHILLFAGVVAVAVASLALPADGLDPTANSMARVGGAC